MAYIAIPAPFFFQAFGQSAGFRGRRRGGGGKGGEGEGGEGGDTERGGRGRERVHALAIELSSLLSWSL